MDRPLSPDMIDFLRTTMLWTFGMVVAFLAGYWAAGAVAERRRRP